MRVGGVVGGNGNTDTGRVLAVHGGIKLSRM